jgi:RNA polymerase sigma factor (sigma-70 family)
MSAHSLEGLIETLGSGDRNTVEQLYRTYEPILRMVVRRRLPAHLRAKFDSVDVVQGAWLDLLDGLRRLNWHFADAAHFRAFLVKVATNRLVDEIRKHGGKRQQEGSSGSAEPDDFPSPRTPRPSETVQADDLWRRLEALCAPGHREILRCKRDGYSLDEIAQRTGMHKSSVRRILYELRELLLRAPAP